MPRSAFAVRSATNKTLTENKAEVLLPEVVAAPKTTVQEKQIKKSNVLSRRKRKRIDNEPATAAGIVVADHELEDTKHHGDILVQDKPFVPSLVEDQSDTDEADEHGEALSLVSGSLPTPIIAAAAQDTLGFDISWDKSYRNAEIKLPAGQSLAITGEYDIWIKKGSISILGATIHSGVKLHHVYAPTTHSIPMIRALTNPFGPSLQTTELHIQSASSGIRKLRRCNPRFSRIWSEGQESVASFGLLSSDGLNQDSRFLAPPDWERHANALCDTGRPPVIMICGPKNAGKSSFARFLTNSFLSRRYAESGVAYLDLDPGQPEYTTPADLSLIHVKTCNLGPSFTHIANSENESNRLVHQHHFGYFSPREDPGHYLDCAKNLYERYKTGLQQTGCPLIINTSGWIQSIGLDILSSLARRLLPTHLVNLTTVEVDDGSRNALQHSIKKLGTSFSALSTRNNPSGPRSASDLRSMQYSSFFHLEAFEFGQHRWNSEMLSFSDTMSLSYSGQERIISGVLLLGNHVNHDMLEAAIDKTVLALVVIQQSSPLYETLRAARNDKFQRVGDGDVEMQDSISLKDENIDLDAESEVAPRYDLRSNKQGIPYLVHDTRLNSPIDPATSYSLGQVMLNRTNTAQKTFEVYTSLSLQTIRSFLDQEMELILVRGQLGMPEWAYLEESSLSKAIQEDAAELRQHDKSYDSKFSLDLQSLAQRTPYVEYEDRQGVGGLNKARRVRRNLGATSNKV